MCKQLAESDLLREVVQTFAGTLMGAEADAVCGAPYRVVSAERTSRRNAVGYAVGIPPGGVKRGGGEGERSIDLGIPSCGKAPAFPLGFWRLAPVPNALSFRSAPKPLADISSNWRNPSAIECTLANTSHSLQEIVLCPCGWWVP